MDPIAPTNRGAAEELGRGRFIQCRLPADLYEWMRLRGFLSRRSMNSIVLESVAAYRANLDATGGAPGQATLDGGPQVKYNVRLDNDTYEWLRTTAFYARVSINSMICAALAQEHAAQAGPAKAAAGA